MCCSGRPGTRASDALPAPSRWTFPTERSTSSRAWLDNHTVDGVPLTRDVQKENAARAQQLRNELIHFNRHNSQRLAQEGFDGYPGMEDLAAMSSILGGVIVLQVNELQIPYGKGSLLLHEASCTSKDAAGHESGHHGLCQSWRKVGRVEKKRNIAQDSQPPPGTPQSQDDDTETTSSAMIETLLMWVGS